MSVRFTDFLGATGKSAALRQPLFFKPYKSIGDVALRVTSVVTAPFLNPVTAVALFLAGIYKLVSAIRGLDQRTLEQSGRTFLSSFLLLLTAPLSPFANAIDAIGSAFVADPNAHQDEAPMHAAGIA